MDYGVFRLLNGLAGRWHVLDVAARTYATKSVVLFPLVLLLLWIAPGGSAHRVRTAVVLTLLAVAIATGVNTGLHHLVDRPRPFVAHHVHQILQHGRDTSFPSDHTAFAFAFVAGLWPVRRRLAVLLGFLAVLLAVSRVVVGVHYPSDVVAGAVVGLISGAILWILASKPIGGITTVIEKIYVPLARGVRRLARA